MFKKKQELGALDALLDCLQTVEGKVTLIDFVRRHNAPIKEQLDIIENRRKQNLRSDNPDKNSINNEIRKDERTTKKGYIPITEEHEKLYSELAADSYLIPESEDLIPNWTEYDPETTKLFMKKSGELMNTIHSLASKGKYQESIDEAIRYGYYKEAIIVAEESNSFEIQEKLYAYLGRNYALAKLYLKNNEKQKAVFPLERIGRFKDCYQVTLAHDPRQATKYKRVANAVIDIVNKFPPIDRISA